MRALVIGGGGFVGNYLVRHLLEEGDTVIATTNTGRESLDGCEAYDLDITDAQATAELIQKVCPEVVYHLAAIAFVPQAESDFPLALSVNVAGTSNVARACSMLGTCPGFLFVSSAEVYGQVQASELPIREDNVLRPANNYSLSKRMAELVVDRYDRQGHIRSCVVRPFNHIGPGQDSRFVASNFALQLARVAHGLTSPILEVGSLEARRDFSDVRDIVRAYRALAIKERGTFNLGSGKAVAIKDLLDALIEISGVKVEIRQDPARMRGPEVLELYGTNEKATAACGWRPSISFRESLKDVYQFWFDRIASEQLVAAKASS
jgi:GDP-4-dehydro-6-deoxy-D-mannose reductase